MSKRKHDGEIDDSEPAAKKRKVDGETRVQEPQPNIALGTPAKSVPVPPNRSPDENPIEEPIIDDESEQEEIPMEGAYEDDNEVTIKARQDVDILIAKQEEFQKKFLDSLGSMVSDFVDDMQKKFHDQQQETDGMINKVKEIVEKNQEKEEKFLKAKEYAEEVFQKISIN